MIWSALAAASCARGGVRLETTAVVAADGSTRESALEETFANAELRPKTDVETQPYDFTRSPFVAVGSERTLLILRSGHAELQVSFIPPDGAGLQVVDEMRPHLYLNAEVPGVARAHRYVLVCRGGSGRVRVDDHGRGDLAVKMSCRTYVDGKEKDETEVRLAGSFSARTTPGGG